MAARIEFWSENDQTQAEDREYLRRVASGDRDAAVSLYDRHARAIYSLVLRIVDDEPEAEGIVQEVFAQAWRQAARYDATRGAVGAWLLMMSRTRAIDTLRVRRARLERRLSKEGRLVECPASSPDPETEVIGPEQARRVRQALDDLPLVQRLAVEMAYYEGLTRREIAERLEHPLGTVKTRIRVGLLKLRDALAD